MISLMSILLATVLVDWSTKPLNLAPEATKTGTAGRRTVAWYRHLGDPAWGGDTNYWDRFAVVKPVDGDHVGRPLLVVLHWRGAGWPGKGVDMQTKLADKKEQNYSAPDDFYILNLDNIRNYHVLWNRTHDQYWWGATANYKGPVREDVPRLLEEGESACEKRVLDTIEWTIRHYGIDRNRVYLCGNSMGGQAAYAIGLAHGEVFAAVNANVPATVWFAAARLGFVDEAGQLKPQDTATVRPLVDPPLVVEWSGIDDMWSRDREVIVKSLQDRAWPHIVLWGDYGHCGCVTDARKKNDLIEKFDWLSVLKNAAYPVFTNASSDDKLPWPFKVWKPKYAWFSGWKGDIKSAKMVIRDGAPKAGQINAYFRWEVLKDTDDGLEMALWLASAEELGTTQFTPPTAVTADVTIRRIQSPRLAKAYTLNFRYGDQSGVFTPASSRPEVNRLRLEITREKQILHLTPSGE